MPFTAPITTAVPGGLVGSSCGCMNCFQEQRDNFLRKTLLPVLHSDNIQAASLRGPVIDSRCGWPRLDFKLVLLGRRISGMLHVNSSRSGNHT